MIMRVFTVHVHKNGTLHNPFEAKGLIQYNTEKTAFLNTIAGKMFPTKCHEQWWT